MIDLSLIVVKTAATLEDIEGRLNELEATGEGACIGVSSIPGGAKRTNIAVFDAGKPPPPNRRLKLVEIQNHTPPEPPPEVLSMGTCEIAAGPVEAALCRE
jgi:hypothetical protein